MNCVPAKQSDLARISFSCGQHYIDNYFKSKMLCDTKSVPYCFWADDNRKELVGIAALSCSGIIIKSANSFHITPAIEVKIFAVDEKYQHKVFPDADEDGGHWSDYCLNYLLYEINIITENVCGAEHVVLYSVPEAVSFYKRNSFESFTDLMQMPSNYFVDGCVPMFLNL